MLGVGEGMSQRTDEEWDKFFDEARINSAQQRIGDACRAVRAELITDIHTWLLHQFNIKVTTFDTSAPTFSQVTTLPEMFNERFKP